MSVAASSRRQGHDHVGGPFLIKYGQDLPDCQWFVNNAAVARTRPFDGAMMLVGVSGTTVSSKILSLTPPTLGAIQTEMAGLAAADLGQLAHNFVMIRYTTDTPVDWWNDSYWTAITAAWVNLASTAKLCPHMDGIVVDNEYYGAAAYSPFSWGGAYPTDAGGPGGQDSGNRDPLVAPGVGIDPTHDLATSRAKVYQRGKDIMDAVRAVWPDIRVMFLHSPAVSAHQTRTYLSPWWNDVAYANELQGSFTAGFIDSAGQGPAMVIDGGEVYRDDTFQEWQYFRHWQIRGLPNVAHFVPNDKRASYRVSSAIGVWDYDVGNTENWAGAPRYTDINAGLVSPTTLARMLSTVLSVCDTYAWLYTEYYQWWGPGNPTIDPSVTQEMLDAVSAARAAGKARRPLNTLPPAPPPPGGGGETFADSFTAANGSAWASPWTTSVGGAGGVVDIQGNRGRMVTPTASGPRVGALYGTLANGEIVIKVAFPDPATTHPFISILLRMDTFSGVNDYPVNGYMISFQPAAGAAAEFWIFEWAGSTVVNTVTTAQYAPTNGVDVWVKARFNGAALQVRAWNNATTEPGTWNVCDNPAALTSRATGLWGLAASHHPGSPSNLAVYWDDLNGTVL